MANIMQSILPNDHTYLYTTQHDMATPRLCVGNYYYSISFYHDGRNFRAHLLVALFYFNGPAVYLCKYVEAKY